MGAPIHTPEMRGATAFVLEHRTGIREPAPVREWRYAHRDGHGTVRAQYSGWFAFWRLSEGIQIAYTGSHPGDIPRKLWREWFGAAHDLEFWNAARRELRITNHPPRGTVH